MTDIGGHPADYTVTDGHHTATFTIDQRDYHGTWQPGPSFDATDSHLIIRMAATGTGSHKDAADALKLTCHR